MRSAQTYSEATRSIARYRNVFEAIDQQGHDEDFAPIETDDFVPTGAAPGTREKIELLRERIAMGLPLWHQEDRRDYRGLVAAVRPRLS